MININDNISVDDIDKVIVQYFDILLEEYIEMLEKIDDDDFLDIEVNSPNDLPTNVNENNFIVLKQNYKTNEKNYYKGDYFIYKNGNWKFVPSVLVLYSSSDFFVSKQIKGVHQRRLPSLLLERKRLNRESANVGAKDTYFRENKYNSLNTMLRGKSVHYQEPTEIENNNTLRIDPPVLVTFDFDCSFYCRRKVESENLIWFINLVDKRGWGNLEDGKDGNRGDFYVSSSGDYSTEPSNPESEERYFVTTFSLQVKYSITSNVTEQDKITDIKLDISE